MSKKFHKIFAFVILFCVLVAGFLLIQNKKESYVEIAGQKIRVDVVRTQADQNKGLSGRRSLNENEGMLFVFENPGPHPFWMKDMNFPIDIIWFDGEGKIVYIKKNAEPGSYPDIFDPGRDASYVLEVASGFSDTNNLELGDQALFTY